MYEELEKYDMNNVPMVIVSNKMDSRPDPMRTKMDEFTVTLVSEKCQINHFLENVYDNYSFANADKEMYCIHPRQTQAV